MILLSNKEHWIYERNKVLPNDRTIISQDSEITSNELSLLVNKTANYFQKKGLKSGDHVSIITENNVEFIVAIFALWNIGAVPNPINNKSTFSEIKNYQEISNSKKLIIFKNLNRSIIESNFEIINFDINKIKNELPKFTSIKFDNESIALMLFTSGSTGKPKCVNLTFNNLYESVRLSDQIIKHTKEDVWLASLPFNHIGGFSIITRSILSGTSLLIPKSLKIADVINSIKIRKPSLLSLVPVMLNNLLKNSIQPWKELKCMFIGGGPIDKSLIKETLQKSFPVILVYGSTETSSMISAATTTNLKKYGLSAGKPLKNVFIEIERNPSKIKQNPVGRIIIKSKSIAKSYYNLDYKKENKSLENGKFITNDLGYFDKNGNLILVGRADDVIISGGENISLHEIRFLLSDIIPLNKFELIAVKDPKWNQSYIIVLETTDQKKVTEIENFLRNKTASYKFPQNIFKVNKIPRNNMDKLQLEKLKKIINADFL